MQAVLEAPLLESLKFRKPPDEAALLVTYLHYSFLFRSAFSATPARRRHCFRHGQPCGFNSSIHNGRKMVLVVQEVFEHPNTPRYGVPVAYVAFLLHGVCTQKSARRVRVVVWLR